MHICVCVCVCCHGNMHLKKKMPNGLCSQESTSTHTGMHQCACAVCVCVRACVRACVRVYCVQFGWAFSPLAVFRGGDKVSQTGVQGRSG